MNLIYYSYGGWRRFSSGLLKAGCMLTLAACGVGCTQTELSDNMPAGGSTSSYVTLTLATPSALAVRSNPTGGESGDGEETGQNYENTITRSTVFFYQGSGVNGDGNTPILAVVPFTLTDNGTDHGYTTIPQQVDLANGTYHLLLLANSDDDWWTGKSLTLDDVRNHIQTKAWQQDTDGNFSDFAMSSAADATVELNSNSAMDPARATVSVERMAARLDYQAKASYDCTDPLYAGAVVEITGAALVNNLTAGCYLAKRVATDVTGGNLSYLGDETWGDDVQANYVIDPWTAQKTAGNDDFIINGTDAQPAKALYGVWFDGSWSDPNEWASYVKPGKTVSDGSENWESIGYTLENTTASTESGSRYSTGVVFKARFHPKGISNYTDGATFFAYGTNLYASMEDMMTSFYGSTFLTDFNDKVITCQTWKEVKDFMNSVLLPNDPSGYYKWLKKQVDNHSVDEGVVDASSLAWNQYMLMECGYSRTEDGTVMLNQNGKVTRTVLRSTGVRTYQDATCYYTWWVRHGNDGKDNVSGVMEYAIVRNNIYKLKVNSIYSLGSDIPTDNDHDLVIDVYVNDWQLLPTEELPM